MMKDYVRKIGGMALLLAVLLVSVPMAVRAQSAQTTAGTKSSNALSMEYGYDMWANPVKSYLTANSDGTFTRAEYVSGKVHVDTYDSSYKLVSQKTLAAGLKTFGGIYCGSEYNFIISGQDNTKQSDTAECFRVVKYSKSWKLLGKAKLAACNTRVPFSFGTVRCTESGGMLYVHTSHEMYKGTDGVSRQANMTFSVRISDMTVTDKQDTASTLDQGYIARSLNQFILADGNTLATVDQSVADPRGVILSVYSAKAGADKFAGKCSTVNLLPIQGSSSSNTTKLTVGGFAASGSSYLAVGSSVLQDDKYLTREKRNIYTVNVPKGNLSSGAVSLNWISDLASNGSYSVSAPQLVKISDNSFMVLWQLKKKNSAGEYADIDTVKYVLVDGSGKKAGTVHSINGYLSDCAPILANKRIVWYATRKNGTPVFYSVSADGKAETETKVGTTKTLGGLKYKVTSASGTHTVALQGSTGTPETLKVPDTVTIGSMTYRVTKVGKDAFLGQSKLRQVSIGANVETIGSGAFYGCKALTKVSGMSKLLRISTASFKGCTALGSFTLSPTLKYIGKGAFYQCSSLTKVSGGSGLLTIGENAFRGAKKLQSISLGNAVTSVGARAFKSCTALTAVTMGKNVKTLGSAVFEGDTALASIVVNSTKLKTVGAKALNGISKNAVITVPSAYIKKYTTLLKAKGQSASVAVKGMS